MLAENPKDGKQFHDFADSLRPLLEKADPNATMRWGVEQLIKALHYVGDDCDMHPEDYTP